MYVEVECNGRRRQRHTKISNARAFILDLSGDAKDRCNGLERRGNNLVVKHLHREGSGGGTS